MNGMSPSGIDWFRDARFGLFMHYGLYSLLGRGEWVQLIEKIHVGEYEKLKSDFTAAHFDADMITDLALEAEMKYVNITTMHHDGFCLFNTRETDFSSVNSAARRDLVGELAEACHRKGLGAVSLLLSRPTLAPSARNDVRKVQQGGKTRVRIAGANLRNRERP